MSFTINTSVSPTQGFSAEYNNEPYYIGGQIITRLPSGCYMISAKLISCENLIKRDVHR